MKNEKILALDFVELTIEDLMEVTGGYIMGPSFGRVPSQTKSLNPIFSWLYVVL
ncbi:MAG: hypothetical protein LBI13_02805 [Streptococcaceae bacterium]|jgi:hypothetical protein|nr:hypothetical protein [Streptococcaceae bacterium]